MRAGFRVAGLVLGGGGGGGAGGGGGGGRGRGEGGGEEEEEDGEEEAEEVQASIELSSGHFLGLRGKEKETCVSTMAADYDTTDDYYDCKVCGVSTTLRASEPHRCGSAVTGRESDAGQGRARWAAIRGRVLHASIL